MKIDRVNFKMNKRIIVLMILFFAFGCSSHQPIINKPFGFKTEWQEGSTNSRLLDDGSIEIEFPGQIYGPNFSGFNWSSLLTPRDQYSISYEVKFSDKFDFVKGGKLPGLCGGKGKSGEKATGADYFSARIMWRKNGKLVSYVYHLDQKDGFGDDFEWKENVDAEINFIPGKWHKISFTVTLNNSSKSDGSIIGKFDDRIGIQKNNIRFRTSDLLKINHLCFNTFYGGSDESWAPNEKQLIWIRNLKVE